MHLKWCVKNNNNGLGTRLGSLQMYRLGSVLCDIGQTQHALCNTSVQQSATAHEMHILGWLVCPCHDCYNFIPPPLRLYAWPSHDQAELKKATPAGHNIGGILTETQLSFTVRLSFIQRESGSTHAHVARRNTISGFLRCLVQL